MDMTNIWKQMQNNDDNDPVSQDNIDQENTVADLDPIALDDLGIDEVKLADTEFTVDDKVQEVEIVENSAEIDEIEEKVEVLGKPTGRPSKLNTDTIGKLDKALKLGLANSKAATFAGISETTFYRWQQEAQKIDEACGGDPDLIKNADDLNLWEFWESIKKAKVDGEISHLAVITDAASNGVWQASAWFLERSNPKDWSRREHKEKDDSDKPIVFEIRYSS